MDGDAGASGRISTRLASAAVLAVLLVGAVAAAEASATRVWALAAAMLALALAGAGLALARARVRLRRCRKACANEAAARRRAEGQARTDPVTGLLSRRGLAAAYDRHRRHLGDRDLVITVLMFAVDRLHQVRAAEGPEGVKTMLGRLAGVLPAVLRSEDDAGRIDGGRFVLVVAAPRYARAPEGLARRLQEAVAAAPEITCLGEAMTLSVGVAQTAAAAMPFERILAEAELALEAALAEGDGRVVPFGPPIAGKQARRSAALHTVAEAFEGGGPPVLYQPIFGLPDRRVCAVQAIARLGSPGGAAGDAAAREHAGSDPALALRLARHVQARAIADLGRLRRQGIEGVQLALEVAERQLADAGFTEALLDQLMLEGLSASDLWLGVREEIFVSRRLPAVLETLERLDAAGAECGIDGLGSGYASLAQLRRAPLGWIKLDPALVNEIAADESARAIAVAARTMAGAMARRVCADGVETAAVADAAAEVGFDCAQGTHFGAPVPLAELGGVVRRGAAA